MNRPLTTIAAIGAVGTVILVMLYYGAAGKTMPGRCARVAHLLRDKYRMEEATFLLRKEGGRVIATLEYVPTVPTRYDREKTEAEMREAATFAAAVYDGEEKPAIRRVDVTRTEYSGPSCFRNEKTSNLSVEIVPKP